MTALSRRMAIRFVTPLSWRASPERLARSLQRFSEVEADSAWQMLQALDAVDDVRFKVGLFNNALEELHHAGIFARLARQHADRPPSADTPGRTQIYDPGRGLPDFGARMFVGEADVYAEFLDYATAAPQDSVRSAFLEIRGDEEDHQDLAYDELVKMVGSRAEAARMIRRVRRERRFEAWTRFGKAVGEITSSLLLSVAYLLFGPFVSRACRRRLDDPSWLRGAGAAAAPGPRSAAGAPAPSR